MRDLPKRSEGNLHLRPRHRQRVALDRLAKRERWGQEPNEGDSFASALDKLAEQIAKSGVKLELRVEPQLAPADQRNTIDVTPAE